MVYLIVLRNFADEPLKGDLANEKLSRALIPSDFAKSDYAWAEPVDLLKALSHNL